MGANEIMGSSLQSRVCVESSLLVYGVRGLDLYTLTTLMRERMNAMKLRLGSWGGVSDMSEPMGL